MTLRKKRENNRRLKITKGLKKYLRIMSEIETENGRIRVKDIANRLGVSMPSVSASLKKLSRMGYIEYEKYLSVRLTPEGKAIADRLRHNEGVLYRFFVDVLKVDAKTAKTQANEVCDDILDPIIQKIETLTGVEHEGKEQNL